VKLEDVYGGEGIERGQQTEEKEYLIQAVAGLNK